MSLFGNCHRCGMYSLLKDVPNHEGRIGHWQVCADGCKERSMSLKFGSDSADDLRGLGWYVAVHNDYAQKGEHCTFWLMTFPTTKAGEFVALKGEGKSDKEALDEIRHLVNGMDFGKAGELNYLPQIEYLQSAFQQEKEEVEQLKLNLEVLSHMNG
jgi:hypothetical protein